MGKKKAQVPAPDLFPGERIINVGVEGLPPGLLMNSAKSMLLQAKTKKHKEIPGVEEDAESRTYRMANKELFIPSVAFYGCLINSSAAYRISKKSAAGLMAGTVRIWPDEIPLGTSKYEIDLRPVVVQRSRIVRARPWLKKWAVNFQIVYDGSYGVTPELLKKILQEGGRRIGILDFRPQHRGQFGRFLVTDWEEKKKA